MIALASYHQHRRSLIAASAAKNAGLDTLRQPLASIGTKHQKLQNCRSVPKVSIARPAAAANCTLPQPKLHRPRTLI